MDEDYRVPSKSDEEIERIAEARSCSLFRRVASCRWRGDLSGHRKSMTPACPGAHLVFGPSRLGYARPSR
jgi:hypothetical protein